MNKLLGLACMLLLLTACNQANRRDANISPIAPKQWTATLATRQKIATHWLSTFADANLSRFVNDALAHNYDLKATAARVTAAREQAIIEGAPRLPQLAFAPSYQRSDSLADNETSTFNALFNLSWEIDLWGRLRDNQQAAQHEASAVTADFQGARLSLAARVAQHYFQLSEAHAQVAVVEQSIKDRRTIVDLVRGRFARGLTGGLDLRLVLTDLATAQAQLAEAKNIVQLLSRRLQVLLGRYPDGNITANTHLPEPPKSLTAGLPADLLSRRPDIIASFARLQSSDAQLRSSEKALLPRITLTASGGSSSAALSELIDPKAAAWNLAAGFMQPIFMGGALQGDIRVKEARTIEAVNAYKNTVLTAFQEVEQALASEQQLRNQEAALKEAMVQTQASRELAVYSYRQGLIQILTLLDSYRSTLNAQSQHLSVRRQLLTNRINLYLALGGGV